MNRFNNFLVAYFGNLAALLTVALLLVLIGALRSEAQQQMQCAPTGVIEDQLASRYSETFRRSVEANVPGGVVHLWTNSRNGTYSILIFPENGITCILDAGQDDRLIERSA